MPGAAYASAVIMPATANGADRIRNDAASSASWPSSRGMRK